MPPHNVNRDEDGRPKTTLFGNALRGRISSQARKRALRFAFLNGNDRAVRTRELGIEAFRELRGSGVDDARAAWVALAINHAIGGGGNLPAFKTAEDTVKTVRDAVNRDKNAAKGIAAERGLSHDEALRWQLERELRSEQGLVVGQAELAAVRASVGELAQSCQRQADSIGEHIEKWVKERAKRGFLDADAIDIDTALFGRMVAARPEFNIEAAAAVSHAMTTHPFAVEGDYFSAGEELNVLGETGAAITSYGFFGTGVYYQHAVVDIDHLRENLAVGGRDDAEIRKLTHEGVGLLIDGLALVQPKGKRNSFSSDVAASWILADWGKDPAMNLAAAFLDPIQPFEDDHRASDLMRASIERLREFHEVIKKSYSIKTRSTSFNAYPPARGNKHAQGEYWSFDDFRAALLAQLA
jgi:CRISPR system Cascade subunit CasC